MVMSDFGDVFSMGSILLEKLKSRVLSSFF